MVAGIVDDGDRVAGQWNREPVRPRPDRDGHRVATALQRRHAVGDRPEAQPGLATHGNSKASGARRPPEAVPAIASELRPRPTVEELRTLPPVGAIHLDAAHLETESPRIETVAVGHRGTEGQFLKPSVEEDLRAGRPSVRICLERTNEGLQPSRLHRRVVVEQRDILEPVEVAKRQVIAPGEAQILLGGD